MMKSSGLSVSARIAITGALLFAVFAAADNYNTWTYSKRLYINTTTSGANITNGVANFPLLVRLVNGQNFTFSQATSTGSDIRFASSAGTHLKYQIERWCSTCAPESAEVWVRVDTIYGNNASQFITMYWGNGTAGDSSSAANTFDASKGFGAVWHLGEAVND
jgi:hypothetical protein